MKICYYLHLVSGDGRTFASPQIIQPLVSSHFWLGVGVLSHLAGSFANVLLANTSADLGHLDVLWRANNADSCPSSLHLEHNGMHYPALNPARPNP